MEYLIEYKCDSSNNLRGLDAMRLEFGSGNVGKIRFQNMRKGLWSIGQRSTYDVAIGRGRVCKAGAKREYVLGQSINDVRTEREGA